MRTNKPQIEIELPIILGLQMHDLTYFHSWAKHHQEKNLWHSFTSWLHRFATEQIELRKQKNHEPGSQPLPAMSREELGSWLEATWVFSRHPQTPTSAKFADAVGMRITCLASRILAEGTEGLVVIEEPNNG